MKHIYKAASTRRNWLNMASIFLAFSVLCSVFYLPCYAYIRQMTRANVLDNHQRRLDTGMRSFNVSADALGALLSTIQANSSSRTLQYAHIQMDTLQLDELRAIVSASLQPHELIREAGLTQGGEMLFTRHLLFYQWEELNWRQYFHSSQTDFAQSFAGNQCVLPAADFTSTTYGNFRAFTIAFRLSRLNNIYLFATVPLDTLFSYLVDPEALQTGSIAVYSDDQLIASSGTVPEKGGEELTASLNSSLPIRVVIHLSDAYIEQDLKPMHRLVQIFGAVVVAAMCLWIAVFAFVMARPFDRISAALRNSSHLDQDPASPTDMVEGIHRLDSKLTAYSRMLAEQEERIRVQTLEKAVYRGLYSAESREDFAEAFPRFPARWQMALIQYAADDEAMGEETLQAEFMKAVHQTLPDETFVTVSRSALLAVLDADSQPAPGQRLESLQMLLQAQSMSASYTLTRIYDDPALLADAFQQLEYETIVLQQMPAHSAKAAPISMQQLYTLFLALQCGDTAAALSALRNGTVPAARSGDFFTMQYSYRMIANTLVRIKLESGCDLSDIPIPAFRPENAADLFSRELPACVEQITQRISQQRMSQSQSLEEDILRFIDENIPNTQLCLTLVTDHFRISAPTLQKRLNACVGKTFSAYVEDVRLSRARRALQETNHTIQEIAEEVGYANANSFYKAYKRCFGTPPRSLRSGK